MDKQVHKNNEADLQKIKEEIFAKIALLPEEECSDFLAELKERGVL